MTPLARRLFHLRLWWQRWSALPGAVFYSVREDRMIVVHSHHPGLGGWRTTVRVVTGVELAAGAVLEPWPGPYERVDLRDWMPAW